MEYKFLDLMRIFVRTTGGLSRYFGQYETGEKAKVMMDSLSEIKMAALARVSSVDILKSNKSFS